ncbi:MAG TPA: class I SAM-dependent methyltransferase, partial [Planctomycetota bacterium]|nr:class I SAM-dependent methyltransferase [Planctomycetota bacterium]
KTAGLPAEVRRRITLIEADVLGSDWPNDFDLVLLGGNCFYELASAAEQESCVARASAALKPGGCVYVDNNHMEGTLDADWRTPGVRHGRFPTGTCADGTRVEGTTETVWFDAAMRLCRYRRTVTISHPDGRTVKHEYVQENHPPSAGEVRTWLESHGFVIAGLFGDRAGSPYDDASPRAVFFAVKG